ncbi:hypothetical protein GLOIN_2v1471662 [Rhizophagus irregularis DAOM 181602=DAOM 197198]|uniref:Uncharacterized protein n=1 Tax=Rhizophagus irregularis (strain DAOM 181602 / DAOM 197198 / MUCL 43194) TaxID=747089 RepID=A0A2P4QS28_RHIID|nr:hypothetical protein GLOIN_2v1471662 [Rhizophagus irregularis DAOM 181602=DAOM 197198]POG80454.1 hypothetical protein GLOIN_2v1471662 [Rhizophagus irregularis DAOM 181602=DAOM 197198]|eukprot:XP_025187320.1 hypothetical protein GLOIN_2v1471662 [Rhizophagus irregularis DAOM 181602=DAOM 197198]
MEQQSFTNIVSQSVDYLGQSHNWTDTDIISSYKEICKQLDICKEKLREEHELQKEESALRAEEKRLIRMKNTLWRRLVPLCIEEMIYTLNNKLIQKNHTCHYIIVFFVIGELDEKLDMKISIRMLL